MVDKAKTERAIRMFSPGRKTNQKVTPIGVLGKEPIILPNYSGMQKKLDDEDITAPVALKLNEIDNPDASKTFNLGNNKFINWTSVDRTPIAGEGIFNWECSGNFTGDLCHIHQHTGNAGANTKLLNIESEDSDATCLNLKANNVADNALNVEVGNIAVSGTVDGIDIATDVAANTTHRGLTNPHIDWTADQGATDIHAGNYTDTTYSSSDFTHDDLIAGTIADHDTSATGTELDTLTDNSMADALHRHSELSASDGTPDACLVASATGIVTITEDTAGDTEAIRNIIHGSDDTPPGNPGDFPVGTIYIQYEA